MRKVLKMMAAIVMVSSMLIATNVNAWAMFSTPTTYASPRSADTNLALNKTATASDVESGTSFTADKAVDGSTSTRWASNADHNSKKSAKWLQIDFGKTTTFDAVDIQWEQQNVQAFQLQVSDDGTTWVDVYQRSSVPSSKFDMVELATPAIGKYLRVYVSDYNGSWPSVSIFEVSVRNTKDVEPEVEGNYTIYPIPQAVTDSDKTIELSEEINVIMETDIDDVTKARVDEVFEQHGYKTVYGENRVEGKTNFYIGVNGSKGLADAHADVPRDVFTEAENRYDMHVVSMYENGDIVILGRDSDAAFYGLATLEQMLDQSESNVMKISTFEDFAFQKYRGAVEGYYGYPWSVEGTLSWMDYAKRYKMNVFMYGPKSDPYHLGKWDEDYPLEVSDIDYENGVRTQDQMRQYAEKAAACNVDFVWVAHPAMQKPIDFTNEETIAEGIDRLMTKFDHMYQLGVRQFGIFVDDISDAMAAQTADMQIYMLNQVQEKLYSTYNTDETAEAEHVKPLFFTPAWYTTGSSGAAANLPKFKNVHPDIEICFTGNNVFSSISNTSATTFKNWIGRTPVMWWNYSVNDAEDSVFFTNPIDFDYSQDPNPTNIKGVLSNPMNFSEASKVSFFAIADYTWNPQTFNAKKNWEHSFEAIIPDNQEIAQALKVVYGNLNNDYVPSDVQKVIASYSSTNKESAEKLKEKMYEITKSIEMVETLRDSDNSVYRLLVKEAQTSFNKLYDMSEAIGGAMAVFSSDDPIEQMMGYFKANAAFERLNIVRNERYKMISLEGAGEDIYNSVLQAIPSEKGLKPFVSTAMEAIKNFDITSIDTSSVDIQEIHIMPNDQVEAKQGSSNQFKVSVTANRAALNEVEWSVKGAVGETTSISKNGVLYIDTNELSSVIQVVATSAYDRSKTASIDVKVTDRVYEDPTIPVNLGPTSKILAGSGRPSSGEGPENVFDDSDTTKWCPGNNSNNNQWVAFDLGSTKQIYQWQTVGGGIEHALYAPSAYSLQVLKDKNPTDADLQNSTYLANNENWEIVAEYKNNKENITNYKFDEPVEGRIFRLFIANGTQPGAPYPATRIFESRIYGVDKEVVARTHSLELDPNIVNGSLEVDSKHYEEGAKVNIAIHPAPEYALVPGSLMYNGNSVEGTSFIMPAEDVVLTASFAQTQVGEDTTFVKSILKSAIDKATIAETSGQLAMLAPKVSSNILTARNAAQVVYDQADASIDMCLQAWLKLANALQYLEFKADKTALLTLIETCEALDTSAYTEESVTVFVNAIAEAKAVYENQNVLQASIDQAYTSLETARLGLVHKDEVDKTTLRYFVEMMEAHVGNGDLYKKDANWTLYETALTEAKALLDATDVTQSQVNQAILVLTNAYENIRLLPSEKQLETLQKYVVLARGISRNLFSIEQLSQIDTVVEHAEQMLQDFDSKQYSQLEPQINEVIAMIVKVQQEQSSINPDQPAEIPSDTSNTEATTNVSTQPKTGVMDHSGAYVMAMLLAAGVLISRRKKQ